MRPMCVRRLILRYQKGKGFFAAKGEGVKAKWKRSGSGSGSQRHAQNNRPRTSTNPLQQNTKKKVIITVQKV